MRAIIANAAGGGEVLELVEKPDPAPGPGEVLVRHAAVGLNFIDVYQRSGLYPLTFPTPMGSEAAGVVEAVGPGVERFKIGDRIAYASGPLGAYADVNVVSQNRAVHVPDGVALDIAAASLLKGMTAEYLLRRTFHVKQGDTILTHAAAGGVGSILTQWAKALGATVIGAVGSTAKIHLAKTNGCDHVLLQDSDVAAQVKALTAGLGVPVVYDSVGKDTFEASLASLARRGLLVSFGNASGPVPAFEPLRLSRGGSLYITRPTLFDYIATTEELDASAGALFEVIASGQVKIEIGQRFALADAREAHAALEGRRTTGSTVLIP
jgi:NADPH2:quinone reductase